MGVSTRIGENSGRCRFGLASEDAMTRKFRNVMMCQTRSFTCSRPYLRTWMQAQSKASDEWKKEDGLLSEVESLKLGGLRLVAPILEAANVLAVKNHAHVRG